MEGERFDAFARALATRRSRRAVISAAGSAFAGVLGLRWMGADASTPTPPGARNQTAMPQASPVASPTGSPSFALVDAAALKAVAAGLPSDPVDAAMALVDKIYVPDDATATAAVGELLRRAAIPLVSTDGPVIGLPDRLVAVNVPVYVDFPREIARSMRQGSVWDSDAAADIFSGFGLRDEKHKKPIPTAYLTATLGQWDKTPKALPESRVAGAAVRALAAHRGQVRFAEAAESHSIPCEFCSCSHIWMSELQGVSTAVVNEPAGPRASLPGFHVIPDDAQRQRDIVY